MILESPVDPRVQAIVDRYFGALRVSNRPLDWSAPDSENQIGGHYSTRGATGQTTTLVAGTAIASVRWAPASPLLYVLLGLRAYVEITTAFGTHQEIALDLVKVSNFSAADSGAGSAAIAVGAYARRGPFMNQSQVTEFRMCGAVALTNAGGSVEEAVPVGWAAINAANAAGGSGSDDLIRVGPYSHPLVLSPGEGWRVRIGVTQGATGVLRYTLVPEWAEVPVF